MSDKDKQKNQEAQEPETQQPQEPETQQPQEPQEHEALPDVVNAIKEQYEQQIATLNAKHAKEVAERDEVIKQLLATDKPEPTETIADRINKRRTYKKW